MDQEVPFGSLEDAAIASGWPLDILVDPNKQGRRVDSTVEFLDFLCRGKHSDGEMFILNEGISKLKLEKSIPENLREASLMKQSPVEALLKIIDQGDDPLAGELFWWSPGETQREAVIGIDLRDKLLRYRPFTETCYAAEVRRSKRAPHARSFEMTDTLTVYDVKDLVASPLPLWDRGHGFFGSTGAGICLHVDQAWWSNVAKNFSGHKLVALWGPGTNVLQTCGGELFRKPLCPRQLSALGGCKRVALLRPGDVACFTGGLPHTTMVVGPALNLTFYESFLNWNCENLDLLLSGLQRSIDQPWWQNNMEPQFVETVLQDILQVIGSGNFDEEKQKFVAFLRTRPLTSARLVEESSGYNDGRQRATKRPMTGDNGPEMLRLCQK